MGKRRNRAEVFAASLRGAGHEVVAKPAKADVGWATTKDLPAAARTAMAGIYRSLGGVRDDQDFTSGAWDFVVDGTLLVEFDEDLHFNRYRVPALEPVWISALPWAHAYGLYSVEKEDMCLSAGGYGGKWATRSSDAMFGGSDRPGQFSRLGPSRWKQRALYDAVKDAYASHTPGIALARVSIHDEIGGLNVNWATRNGVLLDPAALRGFIDARTASPG